MFAQEQYAGELLFSIIIGFLLLSGAKKNLLDYAKESQEIIINIYPADGEFFQENINSWPAVKEEIP